MQDAEVILYQWSEPRLVEAMATSDTEGDSLNLAPSLSKALGPPHTRSNIGSKSIPAGVARDGRSGSADMPATKMNSMPREGPVGLRDAP